MSSSFGGSIPDEIVLTREEAATILLAFDDAVERADGVDLRRALQHAAQIIVDKFLPDLRDL